MGETDSSTPRGGSSKGTRHTGWQYSYHIPESPLDDYYRGKCKTRHEAIGIATRLARRFGNGDWDVIWHESMWRECDEPVVCGHCGFEEWYRPLVAWHFVHDDGPFCSEECKARWAWKHAPDQLRAWRDAE